VERESRIRHEAGTGLHRILPGSLEAGEQFEDTCLTLRPGPNRATTKWRIVHRELAAIHSGSANHSLGIILVLLPSIDVGFAGFLDRLRAFHSSLHEPLRSLHASMLICTIY
jgi:hypothetical protein